jgi:hypothetical protein
MLLRARSSYCCLVVYQSTTIPAEPRCGMTDALSISRHDCRTGLSKPLCAREWTPGVRIARYMYCTHLRMCTVYPHLRLSNDWETVLTQLWCLQFQNLGIVGLSSSVGRRIFLLRTQEGTPLRLLPLSPTPLPCRLRSAGSVTARTLTR